MMTEAESALLVSVNSEVEKTWLINKKNFNSDWNKKL